MPFINFKVKHSIPIVISQLRGTIHFFTTTYFLLNKLQKYFYPQKTNFLTWDNNFYNP